ncbi:MAG: hypothetical protein EOP61_18915, partial [Sphingomonadales bacterium]
MTARQFLQRNRFWFFVVAALLLVYSNGASIGEALGIPYVKVGAFALTLAVLLWFAVNMFIAMSAAMKAQR